MSDELWAAKTPTPSTFNPVASVVNCYGIRGILNPGFKRAGDVVIFNQRRTYDSFVAAGWIPTEVPEEKDREDHEQEA